MVKEWRLLLAGAHDVCLYDVGIKTASDRHQDPGSGSLAHELYRRLQPELLRMDVEHRNRRSILDNRGVFQFLGRLA